MNLDEYSQYAPIVGIPITVNRLIKEENVSDAEIAGALMISGGVFLGSKIVIAETIGFGAAFTPGEILFYRNVWHTLPLTLPVASSVALAYGHNKAKGRLQKVPGYGSTRARMAYTTPFSSGFGPVV